MPLALPAVIHVFTFREGLLSRLGHDLRLSFRRFDVKSANGRVDARVELASLNVDGAMHDGQLDERKLSADDRAKIFASATREVLGVERFGEASFTATAVGSERGRGRLSGSLRLHGREQALEALVELSGRELVASATLTPSSFGIAPFRALAGAIKVQDRVRIEVRTTLPEGQTLETLRETELALAPTPG